MKGSATLRDLGGAVESIGFFSNYCSQRLLRFGYHSTRSQVIYSVDDLGPCEMTSTSEWSLKAAVTEKAREEAGGALWPGGLKNCLWSTHIVKQL